MSGYVLLQMFKNFQLEIVIH